MLIGLLGYGNYGQLMHPLIRGNALMADVIVHDPRMPQDGRVFVALEAFARCDVIIFAVPMHSFEDAITSVLAIPGLRDDTIFVDVCSDKRKSEAALVELAPSHPRWCGHSPWGPEAWKNVGGDLSKLPPISVTASTLGSERDQALEKFFAEKGLKIAHISADDHDGKVVGARMYYTHLNSQVMRIMGLRGDDPLDLLAPLSFQDMKRGALAVAGDEELFFDLWLRVPECQVTFDRFYAAVNELKRRKDEREAAGPK